MRISSIFVGMWHINHVTRRLAREEAEKNGEDPEEAAAAVEAAEPDEEEPTEVKSAVRSGTYELCRKAGIGEFHHKFMVTRSNSNYYFT